MQYVYIRQNNINKKYFAFDQELRILHNIKGFINTITWCKAKSKHKWSNSRREVIMHIKKLKTKYKLIEV